MLQMLTLVLYITVLERINFFLFLFFIKTSVTTSWQHCSWTIFVKFAPIPFRFVSNVELPTRLWCWTTPIAKLKFHMMYGTGPELQMVCMEKVQDDSTKKHQQCNQDKITGFIPQLLDSNVYHLRPVGSFEHFWIPTVIQNQRLNHQRRSLLWCSTRVIILQRNSWGNIWRMR